MRISLLAVLAPLVLVVRYADADCGPTTPSQMFLHTRSGVPWVSNVDVGSRAIVVYWHWGGPNGGNDPNGVRQSYIDFFTGDGSLSSSITNTKWINTTQQYNGYPNTWSYSQSFGGLASTASSPSLLEVWDDDPSRPLSTTTWDDQTFSDPEALWVERTFGTNHSNDVIFLAFPNGYVDGANKPAGTDHTYTADTVGGSTCAITSCAVPYAREQYVAPSNSTASAFHEWTETMTDPELGSWFAEQSLKCEIGDLCNNSQDWYVRVAARDSLIQTLWSDQANYPTGACVHATVTDANLFATGSDGALWQQENRTNPRTGVTQLVGHSWGRPSSSAVGGKPATASWGPNRIDNFANGSDGNLYHAWSDTNGAANAWENLGKIAGYSFISAPDAASWGDYRLDAFVNVTSTFWYSPQLAHLWYDRNVGWSTWALLGPGGGRTPTSAPATASWGTWNRQWTNTPRVDVFQIYSDGNLWQGSSTNATGSTFTWSNLGAPPACQLGDPDVAAGFDLKATQYSDYERWDVFVRDCNGNLWDGAVTQDFNGAPILHGWSLWNHPTNAPFVAGPSVTTLGDGSFLVAANAANGVVYLGGWQYGQMFQWQTNGFTWASAPDLSGW